jgi:hypothetical protein
VCKASLLPLLYILAAYSSPDIYICIYAPKPLTQNLASPDPSPFSIVVAVSSLLRVGHSHRPLLLWSLAAAADLTFPYLCFLMGASKPGSGLTNLVAGLGMQVG